VEKGMVREIGTHEELVNQGGIYRRLHELQYAGTVVDL
jgi:ATP-binding cassette subfamily B protein